MPCYEVNLVSVEISVANKDLLDEALKALGLTFNRNGEVLTIHTPSGTITICNGKAELEERSMPWLNKIKRTYSVKTVELVAKKYKFNINVKPNNRIILRKY